MADVVPLRPSRAFIVQQSVLNAMGAMWPGEPVAKRLSDTYAIMRPTVFGTTALAERVLEQYRLLAAKYGEGEPTPQELEAIGSGALK